MKTLIYLTNRDSWLLSPNPHLKTCPEHRTPVSSSPPWKSKAVWKKIEQKHLLGGFLGQNQNHKLKFFEIEKKSKIFIENCMKMKNFEIEIFRSQKFQNFSLEIVGKCKFWDANFKLLQLFSFSIKLFDFFYRSKWIFRADSFFLFRKS